MKRKGLRKLMGTRKLLKHIFGMIWQILWKRWWKIKSRKKRIQVVEIS